MGQSTTASVVSSNDSQKVREVFRRIVESGITAVVAVEYSELIDWFVKQDGLGKIDRRAAESHFEKLLAARVVVCHSGYGYYAIVGRRLDAVHFEE